MENKILISFLTIYDYKFHVSSDNKSFFFQKEKITLILNIAFKL